MTADKLFGREEGGGKEWESGTGSQQQDEQDSVHATHAPTDRAVSYIIRPGTYYNRPRIRCSVFLPSSRRIIRLAWLYLFVVTVFSLVLGASFYSVTKAARPLLFPANYSSGASSPPPSFGLLVPFGLVQRPATATTISTHILPNLRLSFHLSLFALFWSTIMGNAASSPFSDCLNTVCAGRDDCVAYPSTPFYHVEWAVSYNLEHIVTPAAVVRPTSADDVSGFVSCAAENGVHVQARSGGHSYGNHGLGGVDDALSIDLVNLQNFAMDETTWQATVGSGTLLGDLSDLLSENGNRAMAHGTCTGVGIGGHATVGGIGPASRMWGTSLDHVVEVEVVTADGSIVRASETENSDLFFGMKGAGASFGIVTEFVFETHEEPGAAVQYTYNLIFGSSSEIAPVYEAWQELALEPDLDRRYASEFILYTLGAVVTVTFYGTEDEFEATGIPDMMPFGGWGEPTKVVLDSWVAMVAAAAQEEAMGFTDTPIPFHTKSVGLTADQLPDSEGITALFDWVDEADKGTLVWFLIWSLAGGAINDIPSDDTAFAHRDKLVYYDSYGIGVGDTIESFISGAHSVVLEYSGFTATDFETYPGYINVDLTDGIAQDVYWGDNLPALMEVKRTWDPNDVFSNPQSVRVEDGGFEECVV